MGQSKFIFGFAEFLVLEISKYLLYKFLLLEISEYLLHLFYSYMAHNNMSTNAMQSTQPPICIADNVGKDAQIDDSTIEVDDAIDEETQLLMDHCKGNQKERCQRYGMILLNFMRKV
ncbi:unnamed protein product [Ilex paraguariensis]|uniref:Uncharacterized protein n=1 Tax=Ilex paraguariensis TaxID=185542 RepID=A0ABC8R4F9_9AQUA